VFDTGVGGEKLATRHNANKRKHAVVAVRGGTAGVVRGVAAGAPTGVALGFGRTLVVR